MLRQSITAVLLLLLLITSLSNAANAQSVQRFKINVPFTFVLSGQTLPAGRYVIERTDPTKPNIVTLKRVNGNIVRMVLTQRVEKDKPSTASSLIFIRREGRHYLFQVWNTGAMSGNQIPFALDTETGDQRHTLVTLTTRH